MLTTNSAAARAALWTLLAALTGIVLYSLGFATFGQALLGSDANPFGWSWFTLLHASAVIAAFVALLTLLPCYLLFLVWLVITARSSKLESTPLHLAATSLLLALPLVLTVFASYAAPTGSLGPFWSEAFGSVPVVLLSVWGAVLLPRILVPPLRPFRGAVAA